MLNVILETCAGTLTQGLIYAILSYGIFITYKILDFPDLTVDGSFPLGAAVTAVLLTHGVNAWLTLPIALVIGALAGLCTGLIHVRAKVRDLLAGIITMTALYSINLQIAGSNLMVERAIDTIYTSAPVMALLGSVPLLYRKLIVSLVLVVLIGLVLEWYFSTKNGLLLRAVDRERFGGAFRVHCLPGGTLLQRNDGHRTNGIRFGGGHHRYHAVPPHELCEGNGRRGHRQHPV